MSNFVVNHKKIKQCFQDALKDSYTKLISIKADSGKGKTTLINYFTDICEQGDIPFGLIDFKTLGLGNELEIISDIIIQLGSQLFESYHQLFNQYILQSKNSISLERITLFSSSLGNTNASDADNQKRILESLSHKFLENLLCVSDKTKNVIFFDTYEKASDSVKKWVERNLLYPKIRKNNSLLVVIAGQQIPDVNYAPSIKCNKMFELPQGLKLEDWMEYAAVKNININYPKEFLKTYCDHYHGDPLNMCIVLDPLGVKHEE